MGAAADDNLPITRLVSSLPDGTTTRTSTSHMHMSPHLDDASKRAVNASERSVTGAAAALSVPLHTVTFAKKQGFFMLLRRQPLLAQARHLPSLKEKQACLPSKMCPGWNGS